MFFGQACYYLFPKFSRRSLRFAHASTLWPIFGLHPEKNNVPKSGWWTRLQDVSPLPLPDQNTYYAGRQVADAIVARLKALIPDFFLCAGVDLEYLFRVHLQFFMAYTCLPFLHAALTQQTLPSRMVLVDSHFSEELLQDFISAYLPSLGFQGRFQCKTSVRIPRLLRTLRQWEETAQPVQLSESPGGVWGILTHDEHFKFLQAPLEAEREALNSKQEIRLLLAREGLNSPEGYTGYAMPAIPQGSRLSACLQGLRDLLQRIARLRHPADQCFCLGQLDLLLELCEKLLRFEGSLQRFRPESLVGCLEYSSYGGLTSLLKGVHGYRLLNVQHGIISPSWAFDGLRFDYFLAWNEASAKVIRADGYPDDGSIHVVGNPFWEKLHWLFSHGTPSAQYEDLLTWKGNAPLIGTYPQSIQGYSTAQLQRQYIGVLLEYLWQEPAAKLLIKEHPLCTTPWLAEVIEANGLSERVRIYASNELTLWESFKAVDVVTSVFSAVLLEAVSLGKPTLAIDLENTIARQEILLSDALPVVTQQEAIHPALNRLLRDGASINEAARQALTPHFEQPYAQRLSSILQTAANDLAVLQAR